LFPFRRSQFDYNVFTLNISKFMQPFSERAPKRFRTPNKKHAYPWHLCLLRASNARPRKRYSAKCADMSTATVPTLEIADAFPFWYAWGIFLMRRRKFIALVAGAVAWPLAVRAQQAEQIRRIGILMSIGESDPLSVMHMKSFQQGLRELGWVEGRNVRFDYRWAEGDADRYRTYAAELVKPRPDVILTSSTPAARAQQQASRRIPIVFVSISDPVADGFVASSGMSSWHTTTFLRMFERMGTGISHIASFATRANGDLLAQLCSRTLRSHASQGGSRCTLRPGGTGW
jgi:hypothetical protein